LTFASLADHFPLNQCRLCGGNVRENYRLKVLNKYDVAYLQCEQCKSLQTELPYWLEEAYSANLAVLDTGAAQRNLSNLAAAFVVSKLCGMNDLLDFGGGDGLLCRLLRDYKINCFVKDKYALANYARAFLIPNFSRPQILLAFEVIEHFAIPNTDLTELFALKPDILLASTGIFSNHGPDWWYLTPETGQHVFLYSAGALRLIGERFGYSVLFSSGFVLFSRPSLLNPLRRALLKILLEKHSLRAISALMRLLPTKGVMLDFDSLRSRDD
jgi:hypothetical protein